MRCPLTWAKSFEPSWYEPNLFEPLHMSQLNWGKFNLAALMSHVYMNQIHMSRNYLATLIWTIFILTKITWAAIIWATLIWAIFIAWKVSMVLSDFFPLISKYEIGSYECGSSNWSHNVKDVLWITRYLLQTIIPKTITPSYLDLSFNGSNSDVRNICKKQLNKKTEYQPEKLPESNYLVSRLWSWG